jgi:hypothetical protein
MEIFIVITHERWALTSFISSDSLELILKKKSMNFGIRDN